MEAFPPMPLNVLVGYDRFKNSISTSERSQIEKLINAWAIHTPSLLHFSHYGLLINVNAPLLCYVKGYINLALLFYQAVIFFHK